MAQTQETEPVVAEVPATHKQKTQKWMLALGGVIVVALIYSMVIKMIKPHPQLKQSAVEAPVAATSTPDSAEEFRKKLEAQRAENRRNQKASEHPEDSPQASAERLNQAQQAQADAAGHPYSPAQAHANTAGGQVSPEEQFAQREKMRVLDSRRSALVVKFGTASSTATNTQATVGSSANTVSVSGLKGLSAEQQRVQSELDRVQKVRSQLAAGGNVDVASLMSNLTGIDPTKLQVADNSTPASTVATGATSSQSAARSGQIVGQPASVKARQDGDVLIPTGTVMRAVLDQEVVSDYPGPWRGMIIDDVYDVSKRYIVIPKGTRIVGTAVRISNVNEPISARMGLLTNWFVLPDGSRISTDRAKALDAMGVGAIEDQVNRHLFAQIMGVAAYAMLGSESSRTGSSLNQPTSYAGDVGTNLRSQFAPMAQKYLNLVPTITLRPGTPIRIFTDDDIFVMPWQTLNADLLSNVTR